MFLLKLKKYLAIAGAVIVAALAVWFKGRSAGRQAEQQEQTQNTLKVQRETIDVRAQVDDEIANAGAGGSAGKLRDEWMRDE